MYLAGFILFIWLNYISDVVSNLKKPMKVFDVDSENIAKAERCLQKVLERWEGISSRTEGKYLLAMSDLHLRKKQYHEALEFASKALELCTTRNQPRMVDWAERRIVYLERRIGVNGVHVDRSDVSSGCGAGPSSGVESG